MIYCLSALYIFFYLISYAGCVADWDWNGHHRWPSIYDRYMLREECVLCAFIATIPVAGWLGILIDTAAYQHGFKLYGTPTAKAPDEIGK